MNFWQLTLPNERYKNSLLQEDFCVLRQGIACVADGITRDPIGVADLAGLSQAELIRKYPNPSPAAIAAQTCAVSFVGFLEGNTEKSPAEGLAFANSAIARLNQNLTFDYLEHDFAGCVAVGIRLRETAVEWASIGDCQMSIFSADGTLLFQSPDGTAAWQEYERCHGGDWSSPDYRRTVRSQFRNNPHQLENGACVAYGALTGEQSALPFIRSGSQTITGTEWIVLYSDGFGPLVNHPEFTDRLFQGKDKFTEWQATRAKKERTILVLKPH